MEDIIKLLDLINTTEGWLGSVVVLILLVGAVLKYLNLNQSIQKLVKVKKRDKKYAKYMEIMGKHKESLTALRGHTKATAINVYMLMNGDKFLSGSPELKAKLVLNSTDPTFNMPTYMDVIKSPALIDCLVGLQGKDNRINLDAQYPNSISNLKEIKDNCYDKFLKGTGIEGAMTIGLENEYGLIYMFAVSLYEGSDCDVDGLPLEKRAELVHNFLHALNLELQNNK